MVENTKYEVRESSSVDINIKSLISLIVAVSVGIWAFFGVQERLNNVETNYKLIITDIGKNTDFRIRWPRGELGALPDDSEQFMLIKHMTTQLGKIEAQMASMMHNAVNITRLQEDVLEARENIERLKDKVRANGFHRKEVP
jgi:hypothetical protein